MSGLPSGTVTFLFSDIEGSTRLVKALRERYPQVLAEHRRLVRGAIADQGGHEVDTQGDAFFVAFAGAKRAVLCALEIQRALAGYEWPAGAPVRVRIGIHTGNAVPAEGVHTGVAVHRAARICAVAHGGQVLVSQATQAIIEDDEEEEPGFTLLDLGERKLKDLDRPVRLFQLAASGLDTRAPPAPEQRAGESAHHTLPPLTGAVPRQLPAGVGFFVGRERELKALDELLDQGSDPGGSRAVPVMAVGGMAGVGKTALAVHWARRIADRFPDGQLYVDLRGYDPDGGPITAEAVTGWFLAALGVPAPAIPAELQVRAGLYRSVLAGRRVLIVLDNARDAAQVRPLLAGGPGCLVVVTSRSSLTGLAVADGAWLVRLGTLEQQEAERLLEARLGREPVASEPAAVADLVRLCAGLPLALAITAARAAESPDLPLAVLAGELASEAGRLDALDSTDAATSVRAVFSWSLRQLSRPASRMFALLGVHCGPDISVPAAASLAGIPAAQARAVLAELTRASLVAEHRPGRYVLHDLLRAYAAEHAARVCGEAEIHAAVGRSLDHYLHTMAGLPSFWDSLFAVVPPRPGVSPEQLADHADLMAWLSAEHQVLLQAVEQAADGFETQAWQVAYFLGLSAKWQGKWADWDSAAQAALETAARADDQTGLGWTRDNLGHLHWVLTAFGEAGTQFHHALGHFQQADDLLGQSRAHAGISGASIDATWTELRPHGHRHEVPSPSPEQRRRASEGLGHAKQALALHRQLGRRDHEAHTLGEIGVHHAILGNFELALDTCQQALDLAREISRLDEAVEWDALHFVHKLRGDFRAAIYCSQQALSVRPPDRTATRAQYLTDLGDNYEAVGDLQNARQAWRDALQIFDDLRHPDADDLRARLDLGSGG
jgi:class 3 adenylate cyclase/tetratricopeptide (TPR) repeat protein